MLRPNGKSRPTGFTGPAACTLRLRSIRALSATPQEERDPQTLYRDRAAWARSMARCSKASLSLRVRADEAALAEIPSAGERSWPEYLLFPPALDSCFHPASPSDAARTPVPSSSRRSGNCGSSSPAGEDLEPSAHRPAFGELIPRRPHRLDSAGAVLAQLDGLKLHAIEADVKRDNATRKFYDFAWEPAPLAAAEEVRFAAERRTHLFGLAKVGAGACGQASRARASDHARLRRDGGRHGKPDEAQSSRGYGRRIGRSQLWKTLAARGPVPARIVYLWSWDREDSCSVFLALTQARLAIWWRRSGPLACRDQARASDRRDDGSRRRPRPCGDSCGRSRPSSPMAPFAGGLRRGSG